MLLEILADRAVPAFQKGQLQDAKDGFFKLLGETRGTGLKIAAHTKFVASCGDADPDLGGLRAVGGTPGQHTVGRLAAATLLIDVVPSVLADMSAGGVAPIAAGVAQGGRR